MGVGGGYNRILRLKCSLNHDMELVKGLCRAAAHRMASASQKKGRLSKPPVKEGKTFLSHMSPNMRLTRGCRGPGGGSEQALQAREPRAGVTARLGAGTLCPRRGGPARPGGLAQLSLGSHLPQHAKSFPPWLHQQTTETEIKSVFRASKQ